eukprot:CAMPEP_0174347680 /NCGR_PEP_ID=MMETSP0811_2-20130205/3813_1 /TAXON_ID=73025 ORGANISM="Eutreptiella gymnastica-like, Strain CCMP1594" /NCGR_SAMPLE_ID=MMETSP0811_2 /ASSEMBLY_ACC=CAM_ASM_000667 /LENGTH=36 /DNA_ID= /DNA_START= /DNA_END= /DNA_ORIENTATION=
MEIPLEDMSPERSMRTYTPGQTGQQGWGKAQDSFLP